MAELVAGIIVFNRCMIDLHVAYKAMKEETTNTCFMVSQSSLSVAAWFWGFAGASTRLRAQS